MRRRQRNPQRSENFKNVCVMLQKIIEYLDTIKRYSGRIIIKFERNVGSFENSRLTRISYACLPACPASRPPTRLPFCLPAVRPTTGRRIGPVFSHNTEYQHANTDLLFRLRFIHCGLVSPFILHCFPFSLTGGRKGEKSLKRCR